MTQATIVVAGIQPPEPGKKQGKIIDSRGDKWNVWGDKLHLYQIGLTYNIEFKTKEFNNARYNEISSVSPVPGSGSSGGYAPQPPQARAPSQHPAPPYMPSTSSKDEQIFVCGALNNALSNPNTRPFEIQTTEIVAFVNLVRQCWRLTLGKPVTQSMSDMNDEIPH